MDVTPISRNVEIHIQGDKVLKFVSIKENEVLFDVVGLREPKVRIIDMRPEILSEMKEIKKNKKVGRLTNLFCMPARVSFMPPEDEKKDIVIKLTKTRSKKPGYMLWIATNIKDEIPIYDFKKLEVQPYKRRYALFSLYKRSVTKK